MSAAVILWQLAILASIMAVGVAFGRKLATVVVALWVVWTIVMIFTKFLFVVQLLTIMGGWHLMNAAIKAEGIARIRKALRWMFALAAGGFGLLLGTMIYMDTRRNSPPHPSAADIPTMPARTSPNTASTPAAPPPMPTNQAQNALEYEQAVQAVERKYPQLDQFHPRYDQALVGRVLERRNQLLSAGSPPNLALVRAADEIMGGAQERKTYRCGPNNYQDFPCGESRR